VLWLTFWHGSKYWLYYVAILSDLFRPLFISLEKNHFRSSRSKILSLKFRYIDPWFISRILWRYCWFFCRVVDFSQSKLGSSFSSLPITTYSIISNEFLRREIENKFKYVFDLDWPSNDHFRNTYSSFFFISYKNRALFNNFLGFIIIPMF